MRLLGYLFSGLLFGAGLAVSGMMNPMKVRNFLDVAAPDLWDPSLAFVMGGALLIAVPGYRLIWSRGRPLAEARFHLPEKTALFDRDLLNGAAIFGAGWGIAGLCPGPAFASLSLPSFETAAFVAAMLTGMAAARLWKARRGG